MKPTLELVLKDGDQSKVVAVACGKCHLVARDKSMAERCCMPLTCDMCGTETKERGWIRCAECRAKVRAEKDRERYKKATKVALADYDFDHVCVDGEEYTRSVETVLDNNNDCGPEGDEYVAWAWSCRRDPWPKLHADDIVEQMCVDMWEEAHEHLDADALQEMLDVWLEAQRDSGCHISDESRVVIFDAERAP